jgi:hypothetical protein
MYKKVIFRILFIENLIYTNARGSKTPPQLSFKKLLFSSNSEEGAAEEEKKS